MALAVVGIALGQIPFWHAVIGQYQLVCFSMLGPVCAHAVRDGADIARVVMVGADKAQGGQPASSSEIIADLVERRACRRAAVLRVEG